MILLVILGEFLCGALMFSYWLGLIARKNLRMVGDGNPGASNLWKSAGYKYGIVGIVLDFLKGYFPLVLLVESHFVSGYLVIPTALAPILGHAFSPFLKFRGGKALAVTFGVWCALTKFEVGLVYAILLAVFLGITLIIKKGQSSSDWDSLQAILGMLLISVYLYFRHYPSEIRWIGLGNLMIMLYTNKGNLIHLFHRRIKENKKSDGGFSA
ncbi:acyl-phosphate glycerol 3-phosphate acyltransferase [Pullulanibacillus pueri]|uniref:Glycerol-3-phosphate acyltransferase n=1 Tax=Pullulanibacillus pueri TaxID=1437324 RepID=A0A8J3EKL6_9BACL|nr:glycerol-3-phosphate acyltransferase [Pullulanibacillus pueri]MBM7681300.1 acyl-phosphate glycerol 3-phosphate acyltransferase [Pullulanibacillus pueri]GGH77683.1 glycerol-3-phosphate acyltransferase 1 [Pullulanibacillus pueri]